jgi:nucleoside-diphosphate-sugar epimerase
LVTRGRTPVPSGYRAFCADCRDPAALGVVAAEFAPEVVINFIGYQPAGIETDLAVFRDRISQYVFISSATVYAKPPPRLPITEDTPLGNPFWDYAQAKLACERRLLRAHAEEGFPATIVRPSHTYSNRWIPSPFGSSTYNFAARLEQGRPVPLLDGGWNPWTLTAASDFALGLAGLVGHPRAVGEAVHITSDEAPTWREIYVAIADALGVAGSEFVPVPTDFICQIAPRMTGPLKGDKVLSAVFDNSKLREFVPGFRCQKSLREGLRESVAWLRAHPDQRRFDPVVEALFEDVLTAWRADGSAPA